MADIPKITGADQDVTVHHSAGASGAVVHVQIPNSDAGRKFVNDLQSLLKTDTLPFARAAAEAPGENKLEAVSASSSEPNHPTLSMQLDQIGW